jgi:hypothetical protein
VDGLKVVRHDRTWRYGDSPSILHIHNLGRKYSLWNLYTSTTSWSSLGSETLQWS